MLAAAYCARGYHSFCFCLFLQIVGGLFMAAIATLQSCWNWSDEVLRHPNITMMSWGSSLGHRARAIHQKIVEMMAMDFQPLSTVDDKGFTSLMKLLEPRYVLPSRRYMSEVVLPHIYNEIKAEVKAELNGITSFSFTTDIWSSADAGNHSMISLTAHWVVEPFILKSAILHVQSFPQSHTGSNPHFHSHVPEVGYS